ncbi:MAG: alpha/beta fold hydrolase [Gammaproteobacteria bacterium]|nr:alpha/beta fold hydrolase [Gammaproteobacteria bacterium]
MPKIKVNGVNLSYERAGQGEPLIFVTGFNADRHIWDGIFKDYTRLYDAIAVDNRGCGESDIPDSPYTIEMMADDIIGLCDALGLQACHFIGISMGSAITMMIAHKYPHRCKSIVLTNGFRKIDIRFALFAEAQLALRQLKVSSEVLVGSVLGWCFSSDFLNQPGMVDYLFEAAKTNPAATSEIGYRNHLSALLSFDSRAWIHEITVPTLVIGSDQDMIVPEAEMQAMANLIPGAQYHCFKGVGHCPHIERPKEYNEVVQKFITTC